MTELYLVRHGQTDWNAARRVQGRTDIPLNDTGREQARGAGELLARREWDAIYSSPLSRAVETAEIIGARIGIDTVTTVDALMERDYGDAEGMTDAEIDARFADGIRAAGQETREDVGRRVVAALEDIARARPDERIIVVSHGGAIRAVLHEVDPGTRHPSITNASVHSFRVTDERVHLVAFDDPIEDESVIPGTADIETQNPVEGHEEDESA